MSDKNYPELTKQFIEMMKRAGLKKIAMQLEKEVEEDASQKNLEKKKGEDE